MFLRGRHREAVTAYRRARPGWSGDPESFLMFGIALEKTGQQVEARRFLQAALAMNPGAAEGWFSLALVLARGGDDRGAAEAWRRALALRPGWPEAREGLAAALEAGR